MKALRYHKDGFQLEHVPTPTPGPKDVLIKVHAVAITADELTWPETTKREAPIPGHDIAGTVASVGSEVKGSIAEGDNVFALTSFSRDGGAAEYMVASYLEIARKSSQWVAGISSMTKSLQCLDSTYGSTLAFLSDGETAAKVEMCSMVDDMLCDQRLMLQASTLCLKPFSSSMICLRYLLIIELIIAVMPQMSFEEAAAIPTSALWVYQALRDHVHANSGQKVLVTGAGGTDRFPKPIHTT